MSKKNIDSEYYEDEETRKLLILRRLGIAVLVVLGLVVIFLLLRSCGKFENKEKDLNTLLLEAGKEYYEYNDYLLPNSSGDCTSVSLETIVSEGLIDKSKYSDCENDTTYVKVCKLESGKYHFVAFLDCASEVTESMYSDWNEGQEKDIISDSSDIKFSFQVEYLDTENSGLGDIEEVWEDELTYEKYKTLATTKYYRYKDLQYIWNVFAKRYYPTNGSSASDVKEYYTTAPSKDYIYKDSENTSVSKYFSTTENKVYWVNENGTKKVALTAPDKEYIYADNPIYQTRYRTRVWTETSKPITAAPTQVWFCKSLTYTHEVTNFTPCENNTLNPTHTITDRMIYSCDGGLTEVGKNGVCYQCTDGNGLKTDMTSCGSYGSWGSYTTTPCDTNSDLCEKKTITAYNWYKLTSGERKYYPSNATSSSKENTYYASAPASGLIKDTQTTTKGWKWYKKVETKTSSYYTLAPSEGATKTDTSRWTEFTKWSTSKPASLGTNGTRVVETKTKIKLRQILGEDEKWMVFNNEYMELDNLLKALQDKGYNVYSLDDINKSGELKYKLKLFIRNKEVK